MKKEKKYKEANKFVADAWYDSRKPSVYVDNMKREIPSKRVNDGRFILARELDTKTAKMGAEVLTAEAKFEKLTFAVEALPSALLRAEAAHRLGRCDNAPRTGRTDAGRLPDEMARPRQDTRICGVHDWQARRSYSWR